MASPFLSSALGNAFLRCSGLQAAVRRRRFLSSLLCTTLHLSSRPRNQGNAAGLLISFLWDSFWLRFSQAETEAAEKHVFSRRMNGMLGLTRLRYEDPQFCVTPSIQPYSGRSFLPFFNSVCTPSALLHWTLKAETASVAACARIVPVSTQYSTFTGSSVAWLCMLACLDNLAYTRKTSTSFSDSSSSLCSFSSSWSPVR